MAQDQQHGGRACPAPQLEVEDNSLYNYGIPEQTPKKPPPSPFQLLHLSLPTRQGSQPHYPSLDVHPVELKPYPCSDCSGSSHLSPQSIMDRYPSLLSSPQSVLPEGERRASVEPFNMATCPPFPTSA